MFEYFLDNTVLIPERSHQGLLMFKIRLVDGFLQILKLGNTDWLLLEHEIRRCFIRDRTITLFDLVANSSDFHFLDFCANVLAAFLGFFVYSQDSDCWLLADNGLQKYFSDFGLLNVFEDVADLPFIFGIVLARNADRRHSLTPPYFD